MVLTVVGSDGTWGTFGFCRKKTALGGKLPLWVAGLSQAICRMGVLASFCGLLGLWQAPPPASRCFKGLL